MKTCGFVVLSMALVFTGGRADDGAVHWSLRPLVKPPVPGTAANPIDSFIYSALEARKLTPAPPAERMTLIRRLSYDLTGLPPTPEEAEAFAADPSPDAYVRLVDRLLASPRYGEHWARHWMDAAHYADTHGNDHDHARPNAWPWRDYVIRSLNDDKPYRRFVQEQVAGDALFPDDPQATAALGFLAAGPWDETLMVGVREDTVDHRMAQNLDRDDMVTTVMSTFQSTTVHCARCHDHKFDPVRQRDYYALQAVFAGVDRADRPFDTDAATHARRRLLLAQRSALERRAALADEPEPAAAVRAATEALADRARQWSTLEVVSAISTAAPDGTTFARLADGSWLTGGTRPDKDTFIITATSGLKDIRALRLEVLPDASHPQGGPGRFDNGNFHLSEFHAAVQPARGETDGAVKLEFSRVQADHSDNGDAVTNALDGRPDTWWSIHPRYNEAHEAVFDLKKPVSLEGGTVFTVRLHFSGKAGHQIGRFRLSVCTDEMNAAVRAPVPAAIASLLRLPESERNAEQRHALALHVLTSGIDQELAALPAPQTVYAVTNSFPPQGSFKPAAEPRPIHLLARGEIGKPGEPVGPGALSCLPGMSGELQVGAGSGEAERRAALARWLTDDRNVLTWRSIVNRVWHYHSGRGICDSPNDFGRMGGTPSHPELLDWLAVWFRDEAHGSLKSLHRLIVTSEAWRRSARYEGAAAQTDADNRLLWRANRTRLTGEELRDSLLQMSGQIDLTMGGPSVVQFVHRGKATFMPDGGAPAFLDYGSFDPDAPGNRRRAVYRFLFRTVPDPLMDALDVPDGGTWTPVRSVSTTAVQAFALLNNAFVLRQCEHIADRIAKEAVTPETQIGAAFRLMLLRKPTAAELVRFTACLTECSLADVCQVLLNSNEFMYRD